LTAGWRGRWRRRRERRGWGEARRRLSEKCSNKTIRLQRNVARAHKPLPPRQKC
jgi:hypothetical protein